MPLAYVKCKNRAAARARAPARIPTSVVLISAIERKRLGLFAKSGAARPAVSGSVDSRLLPVVNDEHEALQRRDVCERVAGDCHEVRRETGLDRADLLLDAKASGPTPRSRPGSLASASFPPSRARRASSATLGVNRSEVRSVPAMIRTPAFTARTAASRARGCIARERSLRTEFGVAGADLERGDGRIETGASLLHQRERRVAQEQDVLHGAAACEHEGAYRVVGVRMRRDGEGHACALRRRSRRAPHRRRCE